MFSPINSPTSERETSVHRSSGSWLERFAGAVRLGDRLQLLVEFGLDDADIARAIPQATGARSIRRWRTQGPPATKVAARWEPIDDLCALITFFLADGSYDNAAIVAWLRSRQRELGSRRPLDVLATGDFAAVLTSAERTVGQRGVPAEDSVFAMNPGTPVAPGRREAQSARRASSDPALGRNHSPDRV
jgi:hypothetical protein